MDKVVAVRREDKSVWEKRTPVVPKDVSWLKEQDVEVVIQPSNIRIFSDEEYTKAGAKVQETLEAPFVIGVKEIPIEVFEPQKTYLFFSHTIKGQSYNMSMLAHMIKLKNTLIDYEKIIDEKGMRLIAFGRFAGIAGMIDGLWTLGQKLVSLGYTTPLAKVKRAFEYKSIAEFSQQSQEIAKEIQTQGFPKEISPLILGFCGYGNVSKGAQEMLDFFPLTSLAPEQIKTIEGSSNSIYKVEFTEKDMFKRLGGEFELQDYYKNPQNYESVFEQYLPHLSMVINGIYWDEKYPKLITKKWVKENYHAKSKLQAIADISCDVEGSIEITLKATEPGEPVFVYNPKKDNIVMGVKEEGPAVLAVDILPSEVPKEASEYFSSKLQQFILEIVNSEYPSDFEKCTLPMHLKKATILYKGKLTKDYKYLEKFL